MKVKKCMKELTYSKHAMDDVYIYSYTYIYMIYKYSICGIKLRLYTYIGSESFFVKGKCNKIINSVGFL